MTCEYFFSEYVRLSDSEYHCHWLLYSSSSLILLLYLMALRKLFRAASTIYIPAKQTA